MIQIAWLAQILNFVKSGTTDSSLTNSVGDSVGNKADTAVYSTSTTSSLMRYIKGILTICGIATVDTTDNNYQNQAVGNKTDAAQTTVGTTRSIMGYVKGLLNELAKVPKSDGTVTWNPYAVTQLRDQMDASVIANVGAAAIEVRNVGSSIIYAGELCFYKSDTYEDGDLTPVVGMSSDLTQFISGSGAGYINTDMTRQWNLELFPIKDMKKYIMPIYGDKNNICVFGFGTSTTNSSLKLFTGQIVSVSDLKRGILSGTKMFTHRLDPGECNVPSASNLYIHTLRKCEFGTENKVLLMTVFDSGSRSSFYARVGSYDSNGGSWGPTVEVGTSSPLSVGGAWGLSFDCTFIGTSKAIFGFPSNGTNWSPGGLYSYGPNDGKFCLKVANILGGTTISSANIVSGTQSYITYALGTNNLGYVFISGCNKIELAALNNDKFAVKYLTCTGTGVYSTASGMTQVFSRVSVGTVATGAGITFTFPAAQLPSSNSGYVLEFDYGYYAATETPGKTLWRMQDNVFCSFTGVNFNGTGAYDPSRRYDSNFDNGFRVYSVSGQTIEFAGTGMINGNNGINRSYAQNVISVVPESLFLTGQTQQGTSIFILATHNGSSQYCNSIYGYKVARSAIGGGTTLSYTTLFNPSEPINEGAGVSQGLGGISLWTYPLLASTYYRYIGNVIALYSDAFDWNKYTAINYSPKMFLTGIGNTHPKFVTWGMQSAVTVEQTNRSTFGFAGIARNQISVLGTGSVGIAGVLFGTAVNWDIYPGASFYIFDNDAWNMNSTRYSSKYVFTEKSDKLRVNKKFAPVDGAFLTPTGTGAWVPAPWTTNLSPAYGIDFRAEGTSMLSLGLRANIFTSGTTPAVFLYSTESIKCVGKNRYMILDTSKE